MIILLATGLQDICALSEHMQSIHVCTLATLHTHTMSNAWTSDYRN